MVLRDPGGMRSAPALGVIGVGILVLVGCGSSTRTQNVSGTTVPETCPVHMDPPPAVKWEVGPLVSSSSRIESVLACRYSGGNTIGLFLQGATVTDPATIAKLVDGVNEGGILPTGDAGVTSCPMDDGRSYRLYFQHSTGTGEAISMTASGCETVAHGSHGHMPSQALIESVSALVGVAQ